MSRSTLLLLSVAVSLAMAATVLAVTSPDGAASDVTARYEVRGDDIHLLDGDPQEWHQAAWNRWVELIPSTYRWRVARFEAIAGSSDGQLEPVSDDLEVWILRISDLEPDVRDVALIHELGHLVSLGPGQITPLSDSENCPTVVTLEGCAIAGGVYHRFSDTFWDEEWAKGQATPEDRHAADRNRFVTRYAATNPGEDLAETFVFFVYRLRPDGPTVAEEKIRLLWEFPELVELREAIRLRIVTS